MDPEAGNPFLQTPTEAVPTAEPPRLGILHLMVLTACVALYIGTMQGLMRAGGSDVIEIKTGLIGALHGTAAGAALAGFVLFVARRRRGLPFPVHPGEFLIVMQGGGTMVTFLWLTASVLLVQGGIVPSSRGYVVPVGLVTWGGIIGICLVYLALWIWAFVRLKVPRWRFFLLSIPVSYVAAGLLTFLAVKLTTIPTAMLFSYASPVLVAVALGIVVLLDHLKGLRYPWTHWLGVAVYFCRAATGVVGGIIIWRNW